MAQWAIPFAQAKELFYFDHNVSDMWCKGSLRYWHFRDTRWPSHQKLWIFSKDKILYPRNMIFLRDKIGAKDTVDGRNPARPGMYKAL